MEFFFFQVEIWIYIGLRFHWIWKDPMYTIGGLVIGALLGALPNAFDSKTQEIAIYLLGIITVFCFIFASGMIKVASREGGVTIYGRNDLLPVSTFGLHTGFPFPS